MANILFIADFFADQICGGGELNNDALIAKLTQRGHTIRCANSHRVSPTDLSRSENIIVSNFVNLPEGLKKNLEDKNYIIYEHDHKYLANRDPSAYENYQAPKEHIINRQLYANANSILCQTDFHANIVRKNLQLDNIVSLGGNMWSEEHFDLLEKISGDPKSSACAIMQSSTPHKGTHKAVRYCEALGLDYVLLPPTDPATFLRELGAHSTLIFFPQTPETLSRVVVEARMMGLATKTTNNIGAIHEDWFSMKGSELIDYMRDNNEKIVQTTLEALNV